ncbi:MAG: hypothetical protein SGILL_005422 [Bacillariaceae sp.]
MELDWKSGRVKSVLGKAKVDEDLLSVDKLLGNHTGEAEHGKTSVLEFLGVECKEFFRVFRGKTKRVKANITREVVFVEDTSGSKDISWIGPSDKSSVELKGANDDGKELEELWADSTDFIQVTDGRSDVLVSGLEKRVEFDRLFSDEHTKRGKHGNTSVLKLGFTVLLDGLIVLGGVTERVESRNRVKRSWKSVGELVAVRGELGRDGRSEGGNRGKRKGGKEKLHDGNV